MTKAAVYARISDTDRKAGDRIEDQIQTCLDYAKKQGFEVVGKYSDEITGASAVEERPGLNEAYEAAQDELYEVLVVRSVRRFGRADPETAYANLRMFKDIGVDVYTTEDGLITSKSQFWTTHIRIGLAWDEKEKIQERTTRGRYNAAKQGKIVMGGRVKYGFKKVRHNPETKEAYSSLEVIEAEAAIVRKMFRNFNGGKSYAQIADKLNKDGVQKHTATEWFGYDIQRIITDDLYVGSWYYGRYKVVGKKRKMTPKEDAVHIPVEPIVDEKTFADAQNKAASVARKYSRNPPKELYMLRGRIKCGICGGMYSPSMSTYKHSANKREPYASCPNRSLHLKKDVVEQSVQEELLVLMRTPSEGVIEQHQENTKDLQTEMNNIDRSRQEIATKKKCLRNLLYDEVITQDEYRGDLKDLEAQDAALEQDFNRRKAVVEPKFLDFEYEELYLEYELNQYMSAGVDYFGENEWFEFCDVFDVLVEIVEPTDTPLKAIMRMFSNLTSSIRPSRK